VLAHDATRRGPCALAVLQRQAARGRRLAGTALRGPYRPL